MTIGKGLIGEDGKVIDGRTISSLDPEKIVYTGGVAEESAQVEKWARKGKREFSTDSTTSSTKSSKKDTTEPTVDVLYPETK